MPGVKGAGGPPPKRAAQRRRTNIPAAGSPRTAPAGDRPEVPEPEESWHPVARRWFESLARSGQSAFYEESDWATAWVLAESMSRELQPKPIITMVGPVKDADGEILLVDEPPKAASLAAWLKGMTALMVTEGDRRRAALELERTPPGDSSEEAAGVSSLDAWRTRTDGTG